MTDSAQSLLDKYKTDSEATSTAADVHQKILEMQAPNWANYPATSKYASQLSALKTGQGAADNKDAFTQQTVEACMAAVGLKDDPAPLQYILTIVYDMLREDGNCFSLFEDALRAGCTVFKPMISLLEKGSSDPQWAYVADKGAWLLSSLMSHMPKYFAEDDVKSLVSVLTSGSSCTELGVLEAITNLLKAESFRVVVCAQPGVLPLVFGAEANKSSPIVYKSVFALWMLSYETELADTLKKHDVVKKLKSILTFSRVEKVIRLGLTVLGNFLQQKKAFQAICEDIVEEGILEAVQQLEYEKWRDQELYDDIRMLVQLITSEVKELSNFDRYMRELESGTLAWGFIHNSKFFGENVMKFEQGEFKAVKLLAKLLSSTDVNTLAVACHDIGEFVSLHPLGKKQIARLGVKERVMELMSSTDENYREVRREALLCCQKIMLNKWQDVAAVQEKK
jgi:V-type H+-transporting ATPase subunit H